MQRHLSLAYLSLTVSAASLVAVSAQAQQQVGDIVVTAQKRQDTVNNVSTAIRAFSGQELKELGVNAPIDLGKQVSGLLAKNSGNGASQVEFYLRGVGLADSPAPPTRASASMSTKCRSRRRKWPISACSTWSGSRS